MTAEKLAYIETFGCQMNERDSEIMGQLLAEASYAPTKTLALADLVVINTCSIREKAEQKAFSLLGRLKKMKTTKPSLLIAVAGCVAQQEGAKILERMPFVDIIIGPQHIYRLGDVVRNARQSEANIDSSQNVYTRVDKNFIIPAFLPIIEKRQPSPYKRFVTIMQGCNNFCTYCVVPYTRGRETSRRHEDILQEIQHIVSQGIVEITLLGQNVNSYGLDRNDPQSRSFPELLHAAAEIRGLKRLRFTTSNPKDLSDELMRCFTDIDILCPHFHLPVQSGANSVLQRMNRKYTIETYLEKVATLRVCRPDIAITTDIIVGFPGESDADFESTMNLLEKVRFHGAFSFKYSDRPHTKSATFTDKVPEKEKAARLARLQQRQEQITLERNREYIGRILEVVIEGKSKTKSGQISGRTGTNHIVNVSVKQLETANLKPGNQISVLIEEACQHSLRGTLHHD